MKTRLFIYKEGCPHCLEYLRILDKVNINLPIGEQIESISAFEIENLDMPTHTIMEKLTPEGFNSYPFIYLDGLIVEGGGNSEQLKIFLERFLKEDLTERR